MPRTILLFIVCALLSNGALAKPPKRGSAEYRQAKSALQERILQHAGIEYTSLSKADRNILNHVVGAVVRRSYTSMVAFTMGHKVDEETGKKHPPGKILKTKNPKLRELLYELVWATFYFSIQEYHPQDPSPQWCNWSRAMQRCAIKEWAYRFGSGCVFDQECADSDNPPPTDQTCTVEERTATDVSVANYQFAHDLYNSLSGFEDMSCPGAITWPPTREEIERGAVIPLAR